MFPDENKKNFEELFDLHSNGKINPEVSDSFILDDGALAIAHLKDRKAKGKVIIKSEVCPAEQRYPTEITQPKNKKRHRRGAPRQKEKNHRQ